MMPLQGTGPCSEEQISCNAIIVKLNLKEIAVKMKCYLRNETLPPGKGLISEGQTVFW
jgi:hypothetical protein